MGRRQRIRRSAAAGTALPDGPLETHTDAQLQTQARTNTPLGMPQAHIALRIFFFSCLSTPSAHPAQPPPELFPPVIIHADTRIL